MVKVFTTNQNGKIELQEAYNRCRKDAEEGYKRQAEYQHDYVRKQYDRLQTLDEIEMRFNLWGDDVNALKEFEAFRKNNPTFIKRDIETAKKALTKIEDYFKVIEGEGAS